MKTFVALVDLTAGPHEVVIEYHHRGGSPSYINILWQPPRGGVEFIPANVFSPPSPMAQLFINCHPRGRKTAG